MKALRTKRRPLLTRARRRIAGWLRRSAAVFGTVFAAMVVLAELMLAVLAFG